MAEERTRKHRDSLDDATTEALYTDAPLPPYIFVVENLLYCCYRFEPGAAQPFLPTEVPADASSTIILCIYRHGAGWGLQYTSGGFLSVVVDGFPSPDTGEGAFIVSGFIEEPAATRLSRHYAAFALGRSEVTIDGARISGRLWSADSLVVEIDLVLDGAPPREMSSNDRYLGRNAAGELTTSIWSVTGPTYTAQFTGFRLGPAAPPVFRALAPVKLEWGGLVPVMPTNLSVPEPLLPSETVSRAGLMRIFDTVQRAACLCSARGQILHLNAAANRLLNGHPVLAARRIDRPHIPDAARLHNALQVAASGGAAAVSGHFTLIDAKGRTLLLQVAPIDPMLAGPGAALVLFDDPGFQPRAPRTEILQLLGLTPAEARIAAAVGAGLPPREAATRLGLAESTVRSSLKVIFDKLGIGRQAELVQIVARLEAR